MITYNLSYIQSIITKDNQPHISETSLDMVWLYSSACIRIVNSRNSTIAHSLSAIYIVDKVGEEIVDSFCLSICHLPLDQVEKDYKIYVAAPHLHGNGDVIWLDSSVVALAPVFRAMDDPLYDYMKYALQNGFNFLPLDSLVGNPLLLSLNLIKVLCRSIYSLETSHRFREFLSVTPELLAPIVIRSSPFNFTNASIFADFASTGNLNFTLQDERGCHGYLSDIKYLENMSGALVTTRQDEAVGLLVGNLRKINGDGDLLVIAPWERLLPLLPHLKMTTETKNFEKSWILPTSNAALTSKNPVFPIVLFKDNRNLSWGSCILLNQLTLVTNLHVIKPYRESTDIVCEVVINESTSMTIGQDDEIIIPFESLDLAFIVLSPQNMMLVSSIRPTKMSFSNNLQIGDVVTTSGYGLILNRDHLKTMKSSGHVSSKIYHQPFESSPKIPCVLIASSSCWNGSSGGGLFNERGSLVGLICSNAQVFVPSVNGSVASKTEKVPLFCLCIPLELILECYQKKVVEKEDDVELNIKVEKAWRLESYHQDIFERNSKL